MEYTREQMMAMSPEERQALRRQLEAQVAQPQGVLPKPSPFAGLGKLIAGVGSAYTTGKVPMEMFESGKTAVNEPDWYTKQRLVQQMREEDPLRKAQIAALTSSQQPTPEGNEGLEGIPQEQQKYWTKEPVYQNIAGVPTVRGYKTVKTPAGELYYSSESQKARETEVGDFQKKADRASQAIPLIDEIFSDPSLKTASGIGAPLSRIPGTGWKTAGAKVDQLKGMLTLENMGVMKGVLSDADIKMLKEASTALRQDMPYYDMQKELTKIRKTFVGALRRAKEKGIEIDDSLFMGDITDTDDEIASIDAEIARLRGQSGQ